MNDLGLQVEGSPLGQPTSNRFRFFWAKHVSGFNQKVHCAQCLKGPYERLIRKGLTDGIYGIETSAPYFYICGVAGKWADNLHLVVAPAPGELAMADTVFGMRLTLYNARRIQIEALPDGWNGLPKQFTTCRNFQFGVQTFGYEGSVEPTSLF